MLIFYSNSCVKSDSLHAFQKVAVVEKRNRKNDRKRMAIVDHHTEEESRDSLQSEDSGKAVSESPHRPNLACLPSGHWCSADLLTLFPFV